MPMPVSETANSTKLGGIEGDAVGAAMTGRGVHFLL
jgi:hypothetical protein